jgi:hypothetical protein
MSRLLFGLALIVAMVGCTNIQPVGPLAKQGGSKSTPKQDIDMAQSDPVVVPAPTPVTPKCLVRAEDVTADNTEFIQQQLQAEFEFDRKNMPTVPVTAEITHPK